MAKAALTTAQTLPRFLLPKLSWQAGPIAQHSLRTLSTVVAFQVYSRGSVHDGTCTNLTRPTTCADHELRHSILRSLPSRRDFHATSSQQRDHHFDTLKFVQRLKEEGFTEEQSVAMMKVLSDVIEER